MIYLATQTVLLKLVDLNELVEITDGPKFDSN